MAINIGNSSGSLTAAQESSLYTITDYPPKVLSVASLDTITVDGTADSPSYLTGLYPIGPSSEGLTPSLTGTSLDTDTGAILNNTGRDLTMSGDFSFTGNYSTNLGEVALWSETSTDGETWTERDRSFRRLDVPTISEGSTSNASKVANWADGTYLRLAFFLDGSGDLTFEPTSETVNGSNEIGSFAAFWSLIEIAAETTVTYTYTMDSVDDYGVFETAITLNEGDTVSFDAKALTAAPIDNSQVYIYGETVSVDGRLAVAHTTGSLIAKNYTNVTIDGEDAYDATTIVPQDGEYHSFTAEATSDTLTLQFVGTNPEYTIWYSEVIKNLRVTRANPTLAEPNLYWPMNEGPGVTSGVEAYGNTDYNLTYNNFNNGNWSAVYNSEVTTVTLPTYLYTFDMVDDYATFDTSLSAVAGDTLELTFFASSSGSGNKRYLTDGDSSTTRCVLGAETTDLYATSTINGTVVVDGETVTHGVTEFPTDDEYHTAVITFTGDDTIGTLGAAYTTSEFFFDGVIKDIKFTPTDTSGTTLEWAFNDGSDTCVEANGNTEYNITCHNFNDANWSAVYE